MVEFKITRYSHYFSVAAITAKARGFRRSIAETLIESNLTKKRGRFVQEQKRIYARRDLEREEICFHDNLWEEFYQKAMYEGFNEDSFEIDVVPMYEPVKFEMSIDATPWPEQLPVIDFCLAEGKQKVVTAQPGFGKTMISLYVAAQMGVRFAVVTLGGYEDRWVPEMYRLLGFEPSEVRSCCGCTKLYKLLREVKETGIPDVKAIFLSTATLRDFFKNYKNGKVVGTGCEDIDPRDIWEVLGVGLRITDEAHKDFHANFIADLFSHVPRTIYLTATLFSNQDFMKRMYEILLPRKFRKEGGKLNVYVETVRVLYRLKDPSKVRFNGGQGSYSHTAYEAWIMKDAEREKNYIEAIYKYALNQWVLSKLDGHKLLIFAATIELCQKIRDLLQQRLPDLIINSYTAGDDYQILLDSDIIVSTIGKSGTAVDIPDLTQAIMTVAIDSPNANVQALGRLRELKGDKKFPQIFHYFVCMDIQKQIDYAKSKERLFSNRVTKVRTEHLPGVI
ncbi:DNA helicase [Serratia phage Moabite]|uniref:DNA helicase n=2 Tax=Moabitevirus moabite TaxID=2846181 RepID=A0A4Y5TNZ6_9CAUD|nr:DNA helicase [Serratia phage Moabite]QDB71088.1 DNA helicase [Serratia phage Moabite]QPX76760.1 putative DNA helicase protein [Serratia phage vB_SmaM_Yaphecito]URG14165.1 DNA helicase [Pectobacterium phage vB_ParM-25]